MVKDKDTDSPGITNLRGNSIGYGTAPLLPNTYFDGAVTSPIIPFYPIAGSGAVPFGFSVRST